MVMKDKSGDTLHSFADDVSIPDTLIANLAGDQTGDNTEFLQQVHHLNINLHYSKKGVRTKT